MPSIPNAILYAPGINELASSGAIDGVAQRLARALDHQDDEVAVTYEVRVLPTEPYAGGTAFTEVRELVRCVQGKELMVTHRIYNLDYQPALDDEQPEGNLFTQMLAVARVWAWMGWVFFSRTLALDSIGSKQKTALFVGGCFLLLLTGYLAVLVIAVIQAAILAVDPNVIQKLHSVIPPLLEPYAQCGWDYAKAIWQHGGSLLSALVVLAGLVGLSFESTRAWLKGLVQMFLSFCRYLDGGLGRSACTGKFNDLLEHILEQAPSRVDIISYSMGSLIALDALFPDKDSPNPRTSRVTTMTTIGCPFDLVRTFWPDYFADRATSNRPPRWVNVFSPVDLLGSNFANEDGVGAAVTRGINATDPKGTGSTTLVNSTGTALVPKTNLDYDHAGRKKLDLANAIFGGAYLAHSQYWVRGDNRAESCFKLLVPRLYETGSQSP